jgi:hypothetical protein
MTLAFILVIAAGLAMVFFVALARGRASTLAISQNPTENLQPVDVEAFRNLIDPDEEEFLRASLPSAEFRRIQRERMRAAIDYVSCAAQNAGILLRMGEVARGSSNPATVEAAEKLVDNAIRLRLYAFHAMARLYVGMVLPGARISPVSVAERYEQMTRQVVMLGRLQSPVRGISSAL